MTKELGSDFEPLDVELSDLPQELRWREWMCRIEAVIFASGKVVPREMLQKVIGKSANLELLIEDIQTELKGRPYELVAIAGGWMHRTRPQYSNAIHTAADLGEKGMSFTETEMTVLATIAYHQPISRAGLNELFGREVSRDLISRLQFKKLIGLGPRAPQRGAPFTYVTTVEFLALFDLQSLRELPVSASEIVGRELLQDGLNNRNDAKLSLRLLESGLLEFVPMQGDAENYFESLVNGSARETLDDGEAATLALAAATSCAAILDEKKAIRISSERFPNVAIISTSDMLASIKVREALGAEKVKEALFRGLQDARMRVQERHYQWAVGILGEKVRLCRSLPTFVRENSTSADSIAPMLR